MFLPVGSPLSLSSSIPSSLAATPPSPAPLGTPGSGVSSGMNANALPFYPTSETVESVVGKWRGMTVLWEMIIVHLLHTHCVCSYTESALDDLDLNDFGVSALERSLESSTALPSVGVMLGISKSTLNLKCTHTEISLMDICLSLGGSQFQSSAPVNIPGSFSSSAPFTSPSPSPPVRPHASPFFSTHLPQPGQSESTFLGPSHSSLGL